MRNVLLLSTSTVHGSRFLEYAEDDIRSFFPGGATVLFHADIVYVGESLRLRLPFASLGLVPALVAQSDNLFPEYSETSFSDSSVKVTSSGAQPSAGVCEKAATGASARVSTVM